MRDDDELAINKSDSDSTQPKVKPVLDENRRETHTNARCETESTKHNADKAISCNSTATSETSRQQDFEQQSCESSDKNRQFDGRECQVLIETQSWRTAKNWKGSEAAEERGASISHQLSIFNFASMFSIRVQFFSSFSRARRDRSSKTCLRFFSFLSPPIDRSISSRSGSLVDS